MFGDTPQRADGQNHGLIQGKVAGIKTNDNSTDVVIEVYNGLFAAPQRAGGGSQLGNALIGSLAASDLAHS